MQIVGFNTDFPFDYTNLGTVDISLDNGNFTVSSNVVELSSEGLAEVSATITFDPIAAGYSIPSYTATLLDVKGLPVTLAQGTRDNLDASDVVISTSGTLTITYTPTKYQREFCAVRIVFAASPEQTIDILVRLTSSVAASNFTTNVSSLIDFGNYAVNSANSNYDISLISQSIPIDASLVSIRVSPYGASDTTVAFKLVYVGLSTDKLTVTYKIVFSPFYPLNTPLADARIQFLYNQVPVGNEISVTGTNSNSFPTPPVLTPDQPPVDYVISYKNSSIYTYRITSLTLFGDTQGEYAIQNQSIAMDSVLLPNEAIYIPLTYVQKQTTQVIPKLVLHGIYY